MHPFLFWLVAPFIVFVILLLAALAFIILKLAVEFVASILIELCQFATRSVPRDLEHLFSSPLQIVSIPIAIGLLIAIIWILRQFNPAWLMVLLRLLQWPYRDNSFIRGREIGNRLGQSRRRGSSRPSDHNRPETTPINRRPNRKD